MIAAAAAAETFIPAGLLLLRVLLLTLLLILVLLLFHYRKDLFSLLYMAGGEIHRGIIQTSPFDVHRFKCLRLGLLGNAWREKDVGAWSKDFRVQGFVVGGCRCRARRANGVQGSLCFLAFWGCSSPVPFKFSGASKFPLLHPRGFFCQTPSEVWLQRCRKTPRLNPEPPDPRPQPKVPKPKAMVTQSIAPIPPALLCFLQAMPPAVSEVSRCCFLFEPLRTRDKTNAG